MSDIAIRVEHLGKRYRIGGKQASYKTLRESLVAAATRPFRWLRDGQGRPENTFWALDDVSFEVKHGEAVGIIGRNGAGKSTLLKVISRITKPTRGRVELYGRVGSLLEVGTGFHPELTGRENIYLNGAILGMGRQEIKRKFEEIVNFADVEKFLDTPMKFYSSGMYVRLAFAVAAYLEPEILLVDEVLAVGDAAFQKKSLGKMEDVARGGRTVLFVSHNLAAVGALCTKGILLDAGRMLLTGTQDAAIEAYINSKSDQPESLDQRKDRKGTREVVIQEIELRDFHGNRLDMVSSGKSFEIWFKYEATYPTPLNVVASFLVRNQWDTPIFLQHNRLTGDLWSSIPRTGAFVFKINKLPLPVGVYSLDYSIMVSKRVLDALPYAFKFSVIEGQYFESTETPPSSHGLCLVDGKWRIEESA